MSDRITNADIDQILDKLSRALACVGWEKHDYALALRQPYGDLYYVVSYDVTSRNWGHVHDVPGFQYSTNGFLTKRAAYEAINQTARVLFDLADFSPTRIGQS